MPQGSCLFFPLGAAQGPVNEVSRSAEAEFPEVKVDGRPRRGIVGHELPWAAALQDVEDSVEHVAQGVSTQPTPTSVGCLSSTQERPSTGCPSPCSYS